MPDSNLTVGEFHRAARIASYALATIAISTGLTLLLQDAPRMSTPGWQVAFSIPGLTPDFWGGYMVVCGLGMLAGILFGGRKLLAYGSIAASVALWARVVAALVALPEATASGTAPQLMAVAAGAYFAHGALHLHWLRR